MTDVFEEVVDADVVEDSWADPFAGEGEEKSSNHLLGALALRGGGARRFPLQDANGEDLEGPTLSIRQIVGNNDYSKELSKGIRKWGNNKGDVPADRMQWLLPRLYGAHVLVGIHGLRLGPPGQIIDTVEAEIFVESRTTGRLTLAVAKTKFDVDDEGYLVDSRPNRVKFLAIFPGAVDQVYQRARSIGVEREDQEKN